MPDRTPTRRVGRPSVYDFKNKLEVIGDYMIIDREAKEKARNAVSQFRSNNQARGIKWDYRTETLPNGDLKITRVPDGPFNADHFNITPKNMVHKNSFELLHEDMPFGIWYCVPEIEGKRGAQVIFSKKELPIFVKAAGSNHILPFSPESEYSFMIFKQGWIYKTNNTHTQGAIMASTIFLMKWLHDENTYNDLDTVIDFHEPHLITSGLRSAAIMR